MFDINFQLDLYVLCFIFFFFSSRRRHTRLQGDWSSDVCSSDLPMVFCLGTEGSKSSLLRNGWFQCFSVKELKVKMVPYLEIGVSHVFLFRN